MLKEDSTQGRLLRGFTFLNPASIPKWWQHILQDGQCVPDHSWVSCSG